VLNTPGVDRPVTKPTGSPPLKKGNTGPKVQQLQGKLNTTAPAATLQKTAQLLAAADSSQPLPLKPDGVFGSRTRAAVVTFQQDNGLAADGIVGPTTGQVLDAAAAKAPPQSVGV